MKRRGQANDQESRKSGKKSRMGWFTKLAILSLLFFIGLAVLAPTFLGSASTVNWAIASFAGLDPLKAQVTEVQLGWFHPVAIKGLTLTDASGQQVAKVDSITTEKGLLGWITNSSNLGTVRVDGAEATVVAGGGTTNIEQALASYLNKNSSKPSSSSSSSGSLPGGNIEITNTKLMLVEQGRPERWIVEIPTLKTQLPKSNQLFGPTEIMVRIGDASGTIKGNIGELSANAEQAEDGSIQLRAKLNELPLEIVHILRARLPDLPIENAAGRVTGNLSGSAVRADKFVFDLQQLQITNLAVQAPTLVGPTPARLNTIVAAGRLSLADKVMRLQNGDLGCDFARVQATAEIPWPMQVPTAANPFLAGANIAASGQVDLPKLVTAAQSLVPMRPDTQLRSGQVQFVVQHKSADQPLAQAKFVLSGLEAQSGGQAIRWNEPVSVELSALSQKSGPQFGVNAAAEFCNVQGQGTIENGTVTGNVDLELLHRRLSQFVTLPIASMTGSAKMNLQWNMDANQLVAAKGNLQTAPVTITTSTGGQMQEPAWQGKFDAAMQLRQGTPTSINQMHLEMVASDEQVVLDLHEPLSLATAPAGQPSRPSAFNLSVTGNLTNFKHRAIVWLSEPPQMQVEGMIKLAVSGKIDMAHVEVQQANWDIQPLKLLVADMAFAEPQVIGNFKGKVDSSDLTKLEIEQLNLQSSSFSLVAKDQAADNNARRGQATCVADLQRLLKNSNVLASSQPAKPGQPAASSYAATGQLQAGLAWVVSASGAEFRLQANGKDLVLLSSSPTAPTPAPLWAENQLVIAADGRWVAATGGVTIEPMDVQTPWMNYRGKLSYGSGEKGQDLLLVGQAVYDAGQLSQKIGPMTGNNVQLAGQHTMPVEVNWHRNVNDTTTPALAGLRASARVGWEQARVIGIEVGKADVPVNINAGVLTTAAEIPVSQGVLRWDLVSDLTKEQLIIQQKPMTVLENVAITPEMCSGWLKYVAPLVAETTSVNGQLSLAIQRAELMPMDLTKQTVEGLLTMHKAEVGPGPLSNEVIGIAKQIEQIRKQDLTQPVSGQTKAWLTLPEQRISFAMVDGRVHHRDLKVDIGDATLMTAGSVGVNGQLELLASMPIPDKWTDRGPMLAALKGQSLQFPVRGTISRPQMDASMLGQLGRQAIMNTGQNLIQQQLNKGLDKLFK